MASAVAAQRPQKKIRGNKSPKPESKGQDGARQGAGRPTKRTPSAEEVMLMAVEKGLPIGRACALIGITYETYAHWREGNPELEAKIQAARSRGMLKHWKSYMR